MLGGPNRNLKTIKNLVYRAKHLLTTTNKRSRASFGSQVIFASILAWSNTIKYPNLLFSCFFTYFGENFQKLGKSQIQLQNTVLWPISVVYVPNKRLWVKVLKKKHLRPSWRPAKISKIPSRKANLGSAARGQLDRGITRSCSTANRLLWL